MTDQLISDAPGGYPAPDPQRLTLYGSFTSSSTFKPMLYLSLSGLSFDFRTVNLKKGWQFTDAYRQQVNRYGKGPVLWRHAQDFVDGPLEDLAWCRLDERSDEPRHTRITLYPGARHPS